jgi:hypothetical protein
VNPCSVCILPAHQQLPRCARCGRVRTGGCGSSTNVRVSIKLQLCHGSGARGSIALLSDVETDVTNSVSFCVGLGTMWERQKASCFGAVAKAAKHLHSQHGEVSARKLVASELRKARRARCRKRFIFWESVAAQLCRTGLDAPTQPTRTNHRSAWPEVPAQPGSSSIGELPSSVTVSSSPWA